MTDGDEEYARKLQREELAAAAGGPAPAPGVHPSAQIPQAGPPGVHEPYSYEYRAPVGGGGGYDNSGYPGNQQNSAQAAYIGVPVAYPARGGYRGNVVGYRGGGDMDVMDDATAKAFIIMRLSRFVTIFGVVEIIGFIISGLLLSYFAFIGVILSAIGIWGARTLNVGGLYAFVAALLFDCGIQLMYMIYTPYVLTFILSLFVIGILCYCMRYVILYIHILRSMSQEERDQVRTAISTGQIQGANYGF